MKFFFCFFSLHENHTRVLTPTQDSDVCVGFLRGICVELAHVASLVGERHIGQRHPEFVVREIHQLEPAVLESCGDTECRDTSVRHGVRRKGKVLVCVWGGERDGKEDDEGDTSTKLDRRRERESRGQVLPFFWAFSLIE